MPVSPSLKKDVSNWEEEYGQKSDMNIPTLPPSDILTQSTPLPITPTRRRIVRETPPQKTSIPGSGASEPELEPFDKLTPAQEKMRIKLAGMYAGLGAGIAGFQPYSGLVLIKSAGDRAEEVVRACRHNKEAWKWLERITSSSDLAGCLLGHGIMLYAIMSYNGRLAKNPQLLQMFGYAEEQVLAPPPGLEAYGTDTEHDSGNIK